MNPTLKIVLITILVKDLINLMFFWIDESRNPYDRWMFPVVATFAITGPFTLLVRVPVAIYGRFKYWLHLRRLKKTVDSVSKN